MADSSATVKLFNTAETKRNITSMYVPISLFNAGLFLISDFQIVIRMFL